MDSIHQKRSFSVIDKVENNFLNLFSAKNGEGACNWVGMFFILFCLTGIHNVRVVLITIIIHLNPSTDLRVNYYFQ